MTTVHELNYVSLHAHWQILKKNKWIIICISVLICFFSFIFATFKPTQYKASVLLQIHPSPSSSLGSISNPNQPVYKDDSSEEPLTFHIALIRSKFILSPVIQSMGLDIKVTPPPSSDHVLHLLQFEVPFDYLNKKLYLHIDKSNHFQLFTDSHHLLLAGSGNEWVKNTKGFSIQLDHSKTLSDAKFVLVKRPEWQVINQIQSQLQIIDLTNSAESTPDKPGILQLSFTGNNSKEVMQLINTIALTTQMKDKERKSQEAKKTLEFLYQQLPIIQNSLKNAEMKLNQYRFANRNMDPILQMRYFFTHVSDIDKQLETINTKKIYLSQIYTAFYPDLIALNKIEIELQKERTEILYKIKALTTINQTAVNLVREVDVQKNLYMQLLNKIHTQQVITAGIISDIGILSLATSSELFPTFKPSLLSLVGLLVGLLISSLGVLVWEMFKKPKLVSLDFTHEIDYQKKIPERA